MIFERKSYFPVPNVNAPGQRFDRTIAIEYSGSDFEDTYVVHAGIVDNATKGAKVLARN